MYVEALVWYESLLLFFFQDRFLGQLNVCDEHGKPGQTHPFFNDTDSSHKPPWIPGIYHPQSKVWSMDLRIFSGPDRYHGVGNNQLRTETVLLTTWKEEELAEDNTTDNPCGPKEQRVKRYEGSLKWKISRGHACEPKEQRVKRSGGLLRINRSEEDACKPQGKRQKDQWNQINKEQDV